MPPQPENSEMTLIFCLVFEPLEHVLLVAGILVMGVDSESNIWALALFDGFVTLHVIGSCTGIPVKVYSIALNF